DDNMKKNGQLIFHELANEGITTIIPGTSSPVLASVNYSVVPDAFTNWLEETFKTQNVGQAQVNQIQSILQSNQNQYKLFYTMAVNGTSQFSDTPPGSCSGTNNALCTNMALPYASCPAGNINSAGLCTNATGDMQYDLLRTGDYVAVDGQFPTGGPMR